MKKIKKLWIIGLMVLPCVGMTSAGISAVPENTANPVSNLRIAANETTEVKPAEEKRTEIRETEPQVQTEKKENKALFIVGALVMGILMIIVIYKTKAIEK